MCPRKFKEIMKCLENRLHEALLWFLWLYFPDIYNLICADEN